MRSVKKLLIITLFLGMTFPVFAQDETQSATDEAVSQAFTESVDVEHSPGFLPGHRGRGHHRGPHGNRGRHVGPPTPVPTPTPTPTPIPTPPPSPTDGTYNISYSLSINCSDIPGVVRNGSASWIFVNGVLVNGGGVTVGTINKYDQVSVTTEIAGYTIHFSGYFVEWRIGRGVMQVYGSLTCFASGTWDGVFIPISGP